MLRLGSIASLHPHDQRQGSSYLAYLVSMLKKYQMFSDPQNETYRAVTFDLASNEEGNPSIDRPLIVQFCANDPVKLLASAKLLEKHCDAIDINLGCPQDIAKKGRYGAFLQDDWTLIYNLSEYLEYSTLKLRRLMRSSQCVA